MELKKLSDGELIRLHDHVAESVRHGDPLDEDVQRYGIRTLSALELWVQRMERILDARGLSYRAIDWPAGEKE